MSPIMISCVLLMGIALIVPSDALTALQRITKELTLLKKNMPPGITAAPINPSDMFRWKATIEGPAGTPYEGGIFHLSVTFPSNYPHSPPTVIFTTQIYHCNIYSAGTICLDILQDQWSPTLTLQRLLLSLSSLLSDPNHSSPLNREATNLWNRSHDAYDAKIREWVRLYAQNR